MSEEEEPELSDEVPELPPIDYSTWLPHDQDAEGGEDVIETLGPFSYIGRGLRADEFTQYVESYNFGTIPPDYIVLHHTAIPTIQDWTRFEANLSEPAIYEKRRQQLHGQMEYYRDTKGWRAGPHLFIDERYIWLFSEMRDVGVHATWGNAHRNGGRLHYSIGIEVIGDYTHTEWSAPVARLVGHAVAVLKQRLNTFDMRYLYPTNKPGRKRIGTNPDGSPKWNVLHPERLAWGGISSHRDYNKPECPGNAITEHYYLRVLQEGWERLVGDSRRPINLDSSILGLPSGRKEQAIAYIKQRLPADSEYKNDVELIMGHYWTYAPGVEVDPFLAAAQCILETDALRSSLAARPKRNPAGLGARQEGALSFATWELAVQAHIGQLLAFALRDDEASEQQRQMMRKNPRHNQIAPELRGSARSIRGLNRWTTDPAYASKLLQYVQTIREIPL